jgi:DNA-binding transcriptional regulator YhcF (GntR family)
MVFSDKKTEMMVYTYRKEKNVVLENLNNSIHMENFKDTIAINDYSRVRKHKQIVNAVISATTIGSLKLNDKLPSVNELAIEYDISRDTVVRAYAFLKEHNVIDSVPGKGYYIKSVKNDLKAKVFLLFHKLSPSQKRNYDAFSNILSEFATIDLYIYQNDFAQFKKHILNSKSKEYTHYVMNTHFADEDYDVVGFIKKEIQLEKLILLDKKIDQLGTIAGVYQDFEKDIFLALVQLNSLSKKYNTIKLVFPKNNCLPNEIKIGFLNFCNTYGYESSIIENTDHEKMKKHTIYINLEEEDLVSLIKQIKSNDFVIGKDIGIISYNDTPLKEVLVDGITVISTDFDKLGEQAANMVLNNEREQISNPFNVIVRKSL